MNLLRMSLLVSTLLLSQSTLANICVNTSSNYKMFGSVLRAGALVRGHELAFQDSHFSDYQFFSAENDAELAKQIQNMTAGHCSIILGLFTSRECLIAGPIFKKNKLIGISSSCGHDNIKQFSPYLYTIIPPVSVFSNKTADYLNNRNDLGKIFVLYQPTDIYSQVSLNYFQKKFSKTFTEVPIESDGQFDISKFNYKEDEKITIVFFTYPLPSAKILMELNSRNLISKKTIIIGSSSWTFDVSVFRPIKPILEKANEVVATDVLNWEKVRQSAFAKKFKTRYNREPLNIEILTYDVTKLAIKCYKTALINKTYIMDKFKVCMTTGDHHGISGDFHFTAESPFAERPLYITHLLEKI